MDAAFLENTNQITLLDEIRLLHNEDPECQISQDIMVEKEQNIDLQNTGSKRKSNYLSNMDMDNKNSESKRQRQPSTTLNDHYVLNTDEINLQEDPANFKEVVSNHDDEKWIEAMNEELESI
jgi:uncharacterized protein YpbB